eukprot:4925857-Pleurochrysis_carterae.AAC.1
MSAAMPLSHVPVECSRISSAAVIPLQFISQRDRLQPLSISFAAFESAPSSDLRARDRVEEAGVGALLGAIAAGAPVREARTAR